MQRMSFQFDILKAFFKVMNFFFYSTCERIVAGFFFSHTIFFLFLFLLFHREISDFFLKQAILYGSFQKHNGLERRNTFSLIRNKLRRHLLYLARFK